MWRKFLSKIYNRGQDIECFIDRLVPKYDYELPTTQKWNLYAIAHHHHQLTVFLFVINPKFIPFDFVRLNHTQSASLFLNILDNNTGAVPNTLLHTQTHSNNDKTIIRYILYGLCNLHLLPAPMQSIQVRLVYVQTGKKTTTLKCYPTCQSAYIFRTRNAITTIKYFAVIHCFFRILQCLLYFSFFSFVLLLIHYIPGIPGLFSIVEHR